MLPEAKALLAVTRQSSATVLNLIADQQASRPPSDAGEQRKTRPDEGAFFFLCGFALGLVLHPTLHRCPCKRTCGKGCTDGDAHSSSRMFFDGLFARVDT